MGVFWSNELIYTWLLWEMGVHNHSGPTKYWFFILSLALQITKTLKAQQGTMVVDAFS